MSWARYRHRCVLAALSILLLVKFAHAVELPAGATPGGALPKLDDEITEPFVYPNTLPAQPPEKIRETEVDAPRMGVRGFRILGVKEHASLGISQQSIEQLVLSQAQKLVAGEAARGFTLSMFEVITNAISRYYRERGFFLARAIIPEQKISDGIVTINIVEGFLDQIVYSGNRLYSDEQLAQVFQPLQGESIFLADIEHAVFIVNDFPGLEASVLFGPGLKPGSAAIQVNAREQESSSFISWDNYGSIFTGENRLRGNYQLYNLLGNADLLDLNLILTLNPQNSIYFDVGYQQPLLDYKYLVGGSYNSNNFDVGGNLQDLGINGSSTIINGYMTRIISRERTERMTLSAGLSLKQAENSVINILDSRDKLFVINVTGDYAGTSWSSSAAYQQASLTLSIGLAGFLGSMDSNGDNLSGRVGGSGQLAGGDFFKLSYEYLRAQKLSEFQTLIFKFSGQASSDLLTSLEQFPMGGPDTVRAYPVADSLMDTAWLFSVEWRAKASPEIPQTWLNGLEFSVFYDRAEGSLNDPLINDIGSVSLSGFGFGINVKPFNTFKARVQMAFDLGDEPSDNRSLPFYFSLQYDF